MRPLLIATVNIARISTSTGRGVRIYLGYGRSEQTTTLGVAIRLQAAEQYPSETSPYSGPVKRNLRTPLGRSLTLRGVPRPSVQ
jgi:hypothetical protein